MPEIGYQEVHLANAYARLGYTVKVFTSAASVNLGGSINQLSYKTGTTIDAKYGYEIQRLPSLSYKSKVLPFRLKKNVALFKFTPDDFGHALCGDFVRRSRRLGHRRED